MAAEPVVLLESEENVVKDVVCSLRLVDIPVLASWSVDEAKRLALESRPHLVLARARVSGDENAGVRLAQALAAERRGLPVVALYTPGERPLIEPHRGLFASEIGLPVEFPEFTYTVQRIISGLKSVPTGEASQSPAVDQPTAAPSTPSAAEEAGARELGMLIVYDVQHRVAEILAKDPRLARARPGEVFDIIQEATRTVCLTHPRRC